MKSQSKCGKFSNDICHSCTCTYSIPSRIFWLPTLFLLMNWNVTGKSSTQKHQNTKWEVYTTTRINRIEAQNRIRINLNVNYGTETLKFHLEAWKSYKFSEIKRRGEPFGLFNPSQITQNKVLCFFFFF